MRVLGISGSLRRDSLNRRLLRAAAALLPPGVELVELDPAAIKSLPIYDQDDDTTLVPLEVGVLRQAIEEADGILFATPEYNGSIPGGLKNAIDWASRPVKAAALRNKPVAVVGASPGMFGAVWAQGDLRKALGVAGARVVDRELPVAQADEAFAFDDKLVDEDLELELRGIITDLVEAIHARERAVA